MPENNNDAIQSQQVNSASDRQAAAQMAAQQQAAQQAAQEAAKEAEAAAKKEEEEKKKQQNKKTKSLKKVPVNSSNLDWVAYDEEKKQLFIQFRSGGLYRYDGVPKDVHKGLMQAGSLGRYHNLKIKWKYKYTKLN